MTREIHPDAQVIADYYLGKIKEIQFRPMNNEAAVWTSIANPTAVYNISYREKPKEPTWCPKPGDLILVWDDEPDHKISADFIKYLEAAEYPWSTSHGCGYRHAALHPVQVERDAYKEVLRKIAHGFPDKTFKAQATALLNKFKGKSKM